LAPFFTLFDNVIIIRKSTENDLDFIEHVERKCFPVFNRAPEGCFRKVITSPTQEVWIAEECRRRTTVPAGASDCTYPIADHENLFHWSTYLNFRAWVLGQKLLTHACNQAIARGFEKIILEARSKDEKLINWYLKAGFVITHEG
jgi:hypothetical protein